MLLSSLCLLVVYIHSAATVNITITSSPKLGANTVLCLNESVTLTCHTDQSVANITWRWSNQSEHGETITVIAKLTEVMYTCIASDDGKDMGQASITITANGCAPIVTRENFRYYISRIEGSNLTLTTTTTSNLSISSGYPVWKVLHDQPLPPTAKVINYTIDGGDFVQISCIFKGNLDLLGASLTSYWSVNPPPSQHSDVSYVTDNTTDPYRIAVYQTCLTSGGSCCNFTNQLTILNIPSSLDGYKLSCVESLNTAGSEPVVHTNTTSIIVVIIPRILRGPIKLNDGQSKIMLQCQFNASAIPGVTVVVWKRNDIQLFNSSLYQMHQESGPAVEDQVVSTLTINSSNDYYGTYTCYCYYNRSLVTSSKPITSDPKSLTLQRKSSGGKKHRISRIEVVGFGAGSVVLIIAVLLIFSIVRSRYKHASTTLHVGSDPGDQSTKPLVSPVNDIEVSQPEEEVGSKPRTTPVYGATNQSTVFEDVHTSSSSRTATNAGHMSPPITSSSITSNVAPVSENQD